MGVLHYAATGTALMSAGLWIWSASMNTFVEQTYWDGPPKHLIDRAKRQSRLNAGAAFFTALTVLLQTFA
jgi:hypothetical protein